MTNVFVIAHHTRAEVGSLIGAVDSWLSVAGHYLWMPPADAEAHHLMHLASDRDASDADILVSLGGDGTVLRAVHMLNGAPVPILGVNVGTLGYLTEIEPADLSTSLRCWMNGEQGVDYILDSRMMLQATVQRADETSTISWRALNEVVLERQQSGHTIWIDVSINDEVFARYSADGLIVSTATGSTAYSMSARGPVMSPRHRAMIVTPVSPHMLFDRSLVLDPQESLHMRVVGTRPVDVAIDGRRVTSLKHDDCVTFEPDYAMAHFIRFEQPKFHQIVRAKFGLGDE